MSILSFMPSSSAAPELHAFMWALMHIWDSGAEPAASRSLWRSPSPGPWWPRLHVKENSVSTTTIQEQTTVFTIKAPRDDSRWCVRSKEQPRACWCFTLTLAGMCSVNAAPQVRLYRSSITVTGKGNHSAKRTCAVAHMALQHDTIHIGNKNSLENFWLQLILLTTAQ